MPPSPVDAETRVCSFCKGTRRCAKCSGSGTRIIRRHWPRHEQTVACKACDGSGECQLCHGKGTLGIPKKTACEFNRADKKTGILKGKRSKKTKQRS